MKATPRNLLRCLPLLLLCTLAPAAAQAAWLGGIDFSHPTPSRLPLGERVYIDIDYSHADPGGVRIFMQPLTGGANTPGYSASGSGLLPLGTGTTSRWFTINSGATTVDQVRIVMTSADQSVTYFTFLVHVHYEYGPSGIYNIQFSHGDGSIMANGQNLSVTFDWGTTAAADVRIFARPWFNGQLVPGYAASGGSGSAPSGSGTQSFTFPTADTNVNQVHFTMYNGDLSVLLLEFDVAVSYWWRDVGISNFVLSKPSPGSLMIDENVVVAFDYVNPTGEDILIWTEPWLGADYTTTGYNSGSPLQPPGSGSTSRYFGFWETGDMASFRVHVTNSTETITYVDVPIPALFHGDHSSFDNISMVPERPAILDVGTTLVATFDYHTDHPGDVLAWVLPWFEGSRPLFDFAYEPSEDLASGSGTISRYIRGLTDGAVVDHLAFQMKNADQSLTLLEFWLPTTAFWTGTAATSPVPGAGPAAPIVLGQNYPNPFNPLTTIPVELDATRHVKLSVYDLRGRKVATLVDGMMSGGRHEVPFDGTKLASGQYVYRLEGAGGGGRTMTLVK